MAIRSALAMAVQSAVPLDRVLNISGDSRTANCHSGAAPNEISEAYGYGCWIGRYSGGRVRVSAARNGGNGGDTSAMWLARMPTILANGGSVFVNLIGTNDRGAANLSLETSKRNIEAGIRMQLAAGKIPIIVAELPRGGSNALTGQQLANHLALRDWIKSYFPRIGVRVADPWVDLIDPANAAAGLPLPGLFHDGLHPGPIAAMIIGMHIARQLIDLYPAALELPLFDSPYNASTNVTGWLTSNPLCTGIGGTKNGAANATGPLADGFSLTASAWTGATATLSKEASPAAGELQVIDLGGMPTGASSYLSFEQSISLANIASGNKARVMAWVEQEGLAGVSGVSLDIRFVRGGTAYYVKDADRYLETTPLDARRVAGPMETPLLTLDGTETDIKARLVIYGCQNVPMAGRVKVGQFAGGKLL
ncbi:GDSL-type esterase/lipase family protein [Aquipseudomonas alcaligenes]|uniref:Lysophospholipase L1 n=1 Tax=Aquipseudomonas alcaligenes TaxID=43263 RepID=A0A1N6NCF4_AQUAC|nr:GDSL-type esterase/lipase family protein [Pseudomonas alcaligenes]SIP89702.1 Lysophospholipase L1 [Pseudomonas alcaligenes]